MKPSDFKPVFTEDMATLSLGAGMRAMQAGVPVPDYAAKHIAHAFRAILDGVPADKALGLTKAAGRPSDQRRMRDIHDAVVEHRASEDPPPPYRGKKGCFAIVAERRALSEEAVESAYRKHIKAERKREEFMRTWRDEG